MMSKHHTVPPPEPGRNDPCLCPSGRKYGRKYKHCCQRVKGEILSGPEKYSSYSVRNLVLEEIQSFKQIFDVKLTDTEVKVRDKITDSDVVLFVERVRNLWGSKYDLPPHMPTRADLKFRALYFGSPDILSTVNLLARYSLYCDQIIVIDPFSMFHEMSKAFEHSPFREPQAWVRQIIRDGVYLASLEEWIRNDLVFATAFPLSFHHPLKQKHVQGMKDRLENVSPEKWDEIIQDTAESQFYLQYTPAELSAMEPEKSEIEMIRQLAEDDEKWNKIGPYMHGIPRDKVIETLKHMNRRKEDVARTIARLRQEPRRYEWALQREFESQMFVHGSGLNLLDAKWFAEITGSHLVTDRRTVWNEILTNESDGDQNEKQSEKVKLSMSALAEAFQKLEFYFLNDVSLDFVLQIRKENRLTGFRTYLRNFWNKVQTESLSEDQRLAAIQEFRDGLDAQYQEFKAEFREIEKAVKNKLGLTGLSGAGALISGSMALGLASLGFAAAALGDEAKKQTKHAQPLSIFLDLERRAS
jgi:hypothetical protein